MSLVQWVIVDLDGTVCDTRHRDHHAKAHDWEEFHSRCTLDTPHMPIVRLVQNLNEFYHIGIATGRTANYETPTRNWLAKYDVPFKELEMRAVGDYRPAVESKAEMFRGYDIFLVIEDDERLAEMWRTVRGVTCLQVKVTP